MPYRYRSPLLTLLLVASLSTGACKDNNTPQEIPSVTIMTFNVENLFDNVDDPGKDDRTYLPFAAKQSAEHKAACRKIEVDHWRDQCLDWDWSDDLVTYKLEVVAKAIRQVNDGRGADIIALQEIENLRILNQLRNDYLADTGYRAPVLIEGDDARGIDVAFLTKLPLQGQPVLNPIRFDDDVPAERVADTRGILEATFTLPDGGQLTGFAVHFPAPFHPTGMRIAAYKTLNRLQAALPNDRPAFAAGDFNTTSTEDRDKGLLERYARPAWIVAHELGCGDDCRGSAYYARDDTWSFLDMILWAPVDNDTNAHWQVRPGSVRLANELPEQRRNGGFPRRFDAVEMRGVSDHWPLVMTIEAR